MSDTESCAAAVDTLGAVATAAADVEGEIYDPDIDDTLPPFRPGPEPTATTAGAWLARWGVGLGGWGVFVLVVYLTLGGNLNPYLSMAGLMIGFLVGLTGMGGGALMTPVINFCFGFEPTTAIGTDVTSGDVINAFRTRRSARHS